MIASIGHPYLIFQMRAPNEALLCIAKIKPKKLLSFIPTPLGIMKSSAKFSLLWIGTRCKNLPSSSVYGRILIDAQTALGSRAQVQELAHLFTNLAYSWGKSYCPSMLAYSVDWHDK